MPLNHYPTGRLLKAAQKCSHSRKKVEKRIFRLKNSCDRSRRASANWIGDFLSEMLV